MGCARYVGRVGALAVALGLGAAITTSPGLAMAEPNTSSPSDTASTSTDSGATASADAPLTPSTVPTGTGTASSTTGGSASGANRPGSSTDPQAGIVQASGGANTSVNGVATNGSDADSPDATRTETSVTQSIPAVDGGGSDVESPVRGRRASAGVMSRRSAATSSALRSTTSVVSSPPRAKTARVPATTPSPTVTPAAASSVARVGVESKTAAAVTPVTPVTASVPVTPRSVVSSILSTLLSAIDRTAFSANGPLDPVQTPMLWTVLAWVRREIGQTLSHLTAPAAAQQLNALVVSSPNLLVNPGAEVGDASLSGYASVSMPGWAVTGTPTVIQYGTLRRVPGLFGTKGPTLPAWLGFPTSSNAPIGSGTQFFGGGNVATSTLSQVVDLTGAASEIDGGAVTYALSGNLGGYLFDPSRATVTVTFLDANNAYLAADAIGPVTALGRLFTTGLTERHTAGTIPVGTRGAQIVVTLKDLNPVAGNYNNAYADNLSFTVSADLPAPAPPAPPVSTVGALDHVFMVYMENKGYTDIVGSPNAPYLNSLINAYGSAANYYALTHPSDPNYYPILGGSDFGINYNCAADCFDQPNLADDIEAAMKTWAAYQDGGGGYSTPTDRTPFLAFSDIYDDPARVASHIFDLSQMGTDLASAATAPNFVWFSADEDTNMEGPISTPAGILRFAVSLLTTHQYNVAAGDKYLQETLPVIFDSAVWQDPNQKSAIFLTFDEDYNNISWGIGNQGNHVVMVVIPSPGAVNPVNPLDTPMRGGAFVANDYYNHYSLLRTIEASLGLDSLTNNDLYAQPMNEYWL